MTRSAAASPIDFPVAAGYTLGAGPVVYWSGAGSGHLPVWVFPTVRAAKLALRDGAEERCKSFIGDRVPFPEIAVRRGGVKTDPNDLPPLRDMMRRQRAA